MKGCVLDLRMRDKQGSVVTDYSRYGNDGAVNGGVVWTEQGMRFDGSTGYLDCGNDASVQITGSFSASVWFNPTVWQDGTNGFKPIVAKWNYGQKGWFLGRPWSNIDGIDFRIYHGDGTFDGGYDSGDVEALKGTWIHAVGVFDAGNYVKTYINGVEAYSDNAVQGSFVDADTNFLQIGRRVTAAECFTGSIDDVRIHNYALPLREIKAMYNAEKHKYI